MSKIKIVTDSSSDIPAATREELNISIVPIKVEWAGKTYLDNVTITAEEFYNKFEGSEALPTTSQPSPVDFEKVFLDAISAGYTEILSIHLSSKLSGTYQSANIAKSMVLKQYPNVQIEIVDSNRASYATGMAVIAAAEAALKGSTLVECIQLVADKIEKIKIFIMPATLKYLEKGGRISKSAAMMGTLLNIVPILSIDDNGEIYVADKVRGKKKAIRRILEMLESLIPPGKEISLAVLHANNPEGANELLKAISEQYKVHASDVLPLGPAVGSHSGPGLLACTVMPI